MRNRMGLIRKIVLTGSIFMSATIFCQPFSLTALRQAPAASPHLAVYRVPADSLQAWMLRKDINFSYLASLPPVWKGKTGTTVDSMHLQPGHYIWMNVINHNLRAWSYSINRISYSNVATGKHRTLMVFDPSGKVLPRQDVRLDKKSMKWSQQDMGYRLPGGSKEQEERLLRIATPGDTLLSWLYRDEDYYKNRRYAYRNWPLIKQGRQLYFYAKRLITGNQYYRRQSNQRKKQALQGFVAFSQPLYKSGDTLRFKAWITDRKGNPATAVKKVQIQYTKNKVAKSIDLGTLKPTMAGSYSMNWPLPDSLPMDTRYNLSLSGPDEYAYLSAFFSTEEYELPNISTFTLKTEADSWLRKDSFKITLEAKNASDLLLPDATVDLVAITKNVSQIHADSVFIPDTLWQKTIRLSTDSATVVFIPAQQLPLADISLDLHAILRNSTNEIREADRTLTHFTKQRKVEFTKENGTLHVRYTEDGNMVPALASAYIYGDYLDIDTLLQLPATIALHPMATTYDITVLSKEGKVIATNDFELASKDVEPILSPDMQGDSIGYVLSNPSRMPVWLSLMKGRETIWTRMTDAAEASWHEKVPRKNLYQLSLRYVFDNEEKTLLYNLGVHYNVLQVKAVAQPSTNPGATDTLRVQVTDYKGRPVPQVNLTATAQNLRLKDKFQYPNLPISMQYKRRKNFRAGTAFEYDEAEIKKDTTAALYPSLASLLGCDTLFYYQRLLDKSPLHMAKAAISSVYPEITVHVIAKGKPVQAYITYLNNKPANLYWRNALQPNSSSIHPSFVKATVRTYNQEISIDSIYLQPYYKHELFINVDSIYQHKQARVISRPDSLTNAEKKILESSFLNIDNNSTSAGAWLWTYNQAVQLPYNNGRIIAGPFEEGEKINAFKDGLLDMKFPKESGYQYRITQSVTRLEKMPLFPGKTTLNNAVPMMQFGDTLSQQPMPPIGKKVGDDRRNFDLSRREYSTSNGRGMLQLFYHTDTAVRFTALVAADQSYQLLNGKANTFHNLAPGEYRLVLINQFDAAWTSSPFTVKENGISGFIISPATFDNANKEAAHIFRLQLESRNKDLTVPPPTGNAPNKETVPDPVIIQPGTAIISGRVTDAVSGDPIAGASIHFVGSNKGTTSDANGYFHLYNVAGGQYKVQAAMVGYQQSEKSIMARASTTSNLDFTLQVSEMRLDEVVVIGYGTTMKKSMTAASVQVVTSELQGRVAGVMVTSNGYADNTIQIRGANSINNAISPLIVVDGVPMDELPAGMDTSALSVEVLKGSAATAIYGSRGSNGVIIITTGKNNGPAIRTVFRDYAYWQPNTQTNREGKAAIPIVYPENITNWQHQVIAAAPKGKYGMATAVTKAFKAIQGLLQVPAFLVEGDSIQLIGNAVNYTSSAKKLQGKFSLNNQHHTYDLEVAAGQSNPVLLPMKATASPDTLKPSFMVTDEKKLSDGEERSIPVFAKGTIETTGKFFVLDSDTSFSFTPNYPNEPITLYTENNLLNLLEKELEQLRKYPQACMEQTANKMWGLLMMRQLKQKLNQPFAYQKLIDKLEQRILENQLYSGAWSWWEKGQANLYITTKVLQALRQADSSAAVHRALREGNIYLQNEFPKLSRPQKLEALYSLSESKHVYPYQMALDSIPFDSLTLHQQWQVVRIRQNAGLPYQPELNKLWKQRKETYTGSMYWGNDTWHWYNNRNATMVIATKVVQQDTARRQYLPRLKQYFLAEKKDVYYVNTVEQAEIVNLLLEGAMQENYAAKRKTTLTVNGKPISDFPQQVQLGNSENITLRKEGAGLVYAGFSQQRWLSNPPRKDSLFNISSRLLYQGDTILQQQPWNTIAGNKMTLTVTVIAKKEADYVQVEIPIPAGCSFDGKPQPWFNEHREYQKDKLLIFVEHMPAGTYQYSLPLQARFSGSFTLNPARASLMYFPVFEGNNTLHTLQIFNR